MSDVKKCGAEWHPTIRGERSGVWFTCCKPTGHDEGHGVVSPGLTAGEERDAAVEW